MRAGLIAIVALLAGCASVPDFEKMSRECHSKHRVQLPVGVVYPKATPELRIGPQQRSPGYACVLVTVNESGRATDVKLLEADPPEFGDYLVKVTSQSRYRPGSVDGIPREVQAVISVTYP